MPIVSWTIILMTKYMYKNVLNTHFQEEIFNIIFNKIVNKSTRKAVILQFVNVMFSF